VPERKLGFFVKIKEDDPPPNFGGLTTVILIVFRGLKFESDAESLTQILAEKTVLVQAPVIKQLLWRQDGYQKAQGKSTKEG